MRNTAFLFLIFGLGFVLTSGIVRAQQQVNWIPEEMVQLPVITTTAISPDGNHIAYVVREALMEGEKSEYLSHIWVATRDGSMNRQFTRGDKSAGNPAFSPDGKYLTFTSGRVDDKSQVFRIPLDGGEAERITDTANGVNSYQWSPDGSRIAFTMTDPKTEEEKTREKEKRDVILVDQGFKYSRLYVQQIGDSPLENEPKQITTGERHVSSFDWSPGGSQIVFAYGPTPKIDDNFHTMDIALAPADSGDITVLVDWEGADSNPLFTRNGRAVVFTSHGGQPEPVGLNDVYRVSVEGGQPEALAKTPNRSLSIVGWTRGGSSLLITEPRGTVTSVYRLNPDGSGTAQLMTPTDGVYSDISVSDNGEWMSFTFQTPESPAEVYVSPASGFQKTQLSDVFGEYEFPEMGKTELLSWTSEDGMEIEGLLTYPVNYEEGRKYPLILNVHGGPAGVYQQNFTGAGSIYSLQYFADNGYAILRPNPRGSTGYGKDFRYANVQDWGFGDYEDLMSGVDNVLEMGVAHPDSLVEMGWSYGGYMTSFIVTQTNRFKAVSMGAGLPNLISMVGTTDIPTYLKAHMGGVYWEEGLEEIYERHSAQYHIDKIETPVQIIHGQQDLRVPLAQGQEFYWALREKGVPTEMIIYPRTPHGPREPKFTADVSMRIMKWFNEHLGK